MSEKIRETEHQPPDSQEEVCCRRDFLIGLKKWSKIVIGGALFAATLAGNEKEASAGGWLNSRGGWINGGGWVNRGGGWINGAGGWINGGGSWANGPGGGWANRRGGGGWLNAR